MKPVSEKIVTNIHSNVSFIIHRLPKRNLWQVRKQIEGIEFAPFQEFIKCIYYGLDSRSETSFGIFFNAQSFSWT